MKLERKRSKFLKSLVVGVKAPIIQQFKNKNFFYSIRLNLKTFGLKRVSIHREKKSTNSTVWLEAWSCIRKVYKTSIFLNESVFKQFVVTNCSKEQPGWIVTKTLKNWILISIATSKESHFNANFKCISFIKFSLTHQKLQAWENLHYLRK